MCSLSLLPEKPNYFVKELSDLKVDESGTAVFMCQSEKAASSVVWRKGMAELRAGRKYEITQKGQVLQLTIKNLEKSDSDTYTCDIGDAQSRAKLVVQGMHERNVFVHPVPPAENIICVDRSISQHMANKSSDFWLCLIHDVCTLHRAWGQKHRNMQSDSSV